MITRIVKLTFQKEHVPQFLLVFDEMKHQIASFEGCNSLELKKDVGHDNVFFTVSKWNSEDDLNAYRNSALFNNIWSKAKALFADKPQAWSLEDVA